MSYSSVDNMSVLVRVGFVVSAQCCCLAKWTFGLLSNYLLVLLLLTHKHLTALKQHAQKEIQAYANTYVLALCAM